MKLLDCPPWVQDEDSALPGIAQAALAFGAFLGRQNPKGYILTHGDIKQWHRKFFHETVPVSYYAGNYRQAKNTSKPCLDGEAHVNGVHGSLAVEVEQLMKKFSESIGKATIATDEYLATPRSLPDQIKASAQIAAFAGGTIIKIHPFVNGNGRMARMVMNFYLHRYLERIPFFIDRPTNPDYALASEIAMRTGNFGPLYQYLVELLITLV